MGYLCIEFGQVRRMSKTKRRYFLVQLHQHCYALSAVLYLPLPCSFSSLLILCFHTFFSACDCFCFLSLCSLLLYLRCFSDLPQQTPPFLLFLPALHLPLLSLIIPPHLLLDRGSIREGENPALAFSSTPAVSLAIYLLYVNSLIVKAFI